MYSHENHTQQIAQPGVHFYIVRIARRHALYCKCDSHVQWPTWATRTFRSLALSTPEALPQSLVPNEALTSIALSHDAISSIYQQESGQIIKLTHREARASMTELAMLQSALAVRMCCRNILHQTIILHYRAEKWNQRLGQPETENQLGARHEHLGRQSFEEAGDTFILQHAGHDSEARLGVLEITVLNAGFDDVEGRGDNQAGRCTGDGSDEVLAPGSLVVILEFEQLFFGPGRSSEERERTRGISRGCPPSSPI